MKILTLQFLADDESALIEAGQAVGGQLYQKGVKLSECLELIGLGMAEEDEE